MAQTNSENQLNKSKQLYYYLKNINLFDTEDSLALADQLNSTRLFISSLVISLSIITFFNIFSLQTTTQTIKSPTDTIFQQLSAQYPTTLSCPCTQTTIRYDRFISLYPDYHPICTSQFINQTFISSLYDKNMSDYYPLDYRVMAASHFQLLALFCQTMVQTISDDLEDFSTSYILSTKALPFETYKIQVAAIIEKLKSTIITTTHYTNSFILLSISQNEILSALRTNYWIQSDPITNIISTAFIKYKTLNSSCSCVRDRACVHQAGIYNRTGRTNLRNLSTYGDQVSDPPLLVSVPGMMVGCLPYYALLSSTLECFYNQSCIDQLQTFIRGFSLVTPLLSSSFEQNTTVSELFNNLFIESWNQAMNYSGYFYTCSPLTCSYSYNRRFNLFHAIIMITSLFGGLKTILHFISPLLLSFVRRIQTSRNARKTNDTTPTFNQIGEKRSEPFVYAFILVIFQCCLVGVKNLFLSRISILYQKVLTLNIFPSSNEIVDGLYATRIYILLLSCGVLILIFYSSVNVRTRIDQISQPSLNEYEQLYLHYSSTLVCPCTHLSIPYSTIIDIKPYFHQVCSSDLVKNDNWILNFGSGRSRYYTLDFRGRQVELVSILQMLCNKSSEAVANAIIAFNSLQLVSARVLRKDLFDVRISVLIRQFQQQVFYT